MDSRVRSRTAPALSVLATVLAASLCGCAQVNNVAADVTASLGHVASRIAHPFTPEPVSAPAPAGLDDYKAEVARHVASRNPERVYAGTLPAMLPAIVVLEITVDREGRMTAVGVQRARDAHATEVALESMRRSAPLPAPQRLARAGGSLKFSETFLFADAERYQLRSLASAQATR